MERQFTKEIESLRLGDGETFHGEGILAVTKALLAKNLSEGKRTVRVKYGVDEDTCTGDHSCIRLSGCPTLTVKDNPDPLRRDPVATVIDGCVGCGLCGENAHAAVLCPSFYRAEVVQNPTFLDKLVHRLV